MKITQQKFGLSLGYLRSLSTRFLMGIIALTIANVADWAVAQSSVQFSIGESARLLEASLDLQRGDISQLDYNVIQMTETCKSPSSRLQNRNRPWMMVWNTSDTPDDVATVTIDLTEAGFEFGDGDMVGDGFNGFLSMLSNRSDAGVTLDSANYGSGNTDNTELELDFSGLSLGLAAIFRVDLDEPGGVTMFPDFRAAMLGADRGNGPGQLATLRTDFGSGDSTIATFNQASPLSTSGLSEAYHGQTMSMVETSTTIPEPTSLMLLLAGLVGTGLMRRHS